MSVPGGGGSAAEKTATRTETDESGPDLLGRRIESQNLARSPEAGPDLLKLGRRGESQNLARPPEAGRDLLKRGQRVESANLGRSSEAGPDLLKLGRRVESTNLGRSPKEAEVTRARTIREKIARWLEEKL